MTRGEMRMFARPIVRAAPLLPLIFVLIGLPMAMELVPPNAFYGIRTAETLAVDEVWYAANSAAGTVAVLFGLAATAINISVRRSASATAGQKLHVPVVTTVFVAIATTIAGLTAI
jgi:uncharacterized membrane protein